MESEHPDPDREACSLTRSSMAAYLDGSADRSRQRVLRAHLAGCPDCRADFADDIALTSLMARGTREARAAEGRLKRRRHQRSMALAGAFSGWSGGARGAHLRLMLVPAFLVLLLTRVTPGPVAADRLSAQALQGEVLVGSQPIASSQDARDLRRGEACATGPDGRARLIGEGSVLELAPNTLLWIEEHEPPRVRLGEGLVELEGDPTLTMQMGVLECTDARAEVGLSDGALWIEVHAGVVRFFDSAGERALHAGESLRLP